jgi:hypothetical protein
MPCIIRQPCLSASFFMDSGVPEARRNLRRKSRTRFIQDSSVSDSRSRIGARSAGMAHSPRQAQRPAKGRGGRRKGEVHLREGEVPPEPPMGGQLPKTSPLGKILIFAKAPCGKWIAFRRQCGSASSSVVNERNPALGNVNRFPTGRFETFECTWAARGEPRPSGTSPSNCGHCARHNGPR